jgi:farnesyl-diphosphate farnesyltransferase
LAQQGIESGMQYADAVRSRRVRAASAMPALIGTRTLALVRANGPLIRQQKVKVPRREVRLLMARLAITLAGRASLQSMFNHLPAEGRTGEWENRGP